MMKKTSPPARVMAGRGRVVERAGNLEKKDIARRRNVVSSSPDFWVVVAFV